jgi:hypothetical protein
MRVLEYRSLLSYGEAKSWGVEYEISEELLCKMHGDEKVHILVLWTL